MRRIFLMALASSALALLAPGVASASHHGKSRHHAHHARHRSSRPRLLQFGAPIPATGAAGSAPQSSSGIAPGSPATTTTSPSPTGETAGTVKSFTEGVLAITLNDGTTVSGKVTEETEIHCQSAAPRARRR